MSLRDQVQPTASRESVIVKFADTMGRCVQTGSGRARHAHFTPGFAGSGISAQPACGSMPDIGGGAPAISSPIVQSEEASSP